MTEPKRGGATARKVVLLGAGILLFVLALYKAGPAQIGAELLRLRAGTVWLLLPYALGTALGAAPWALLLPTTARPRATAVVAGRFVASSANALLPFFGLAGEPARLLWLDSEARPEGLAAIVVDRVLYNCSNGLLLLGGAAVALASTALPRGIAFGAVAAGVLMLIATIGILLLVVRFGVGRRLQGWLAKTFGPAYLSEGSGERVDRALLGILRLGFWPLLRGALVHVVGRGTILLEVFVGLHLLGAPFTIADAVVLAVVPIGLSLVFSSIPSQVGVQEGGQALVAAALGMSPALGVTLVLLQRLRQLAFAALVPLLLRSARPEGHSAGRSTETRENTKSRWTG